MESHMNFGDAINAMKDLETRTRRADWGDRTMCIIRDMALMPPRARTLATYTASGAEYELSPEDRAAEDWVVDDGNH